MTAAIPYANDLFGSSRSEPTLPNAMPGSEMGTAAGGATSFAAEVNALRTEFAEQNARLLALVSQRLAGPGSSLPKTDTPQMLKVSSPHGPAECVGTYILQAGLMPNGCPVWKHIESQHWLYSMSTGKWGIGGDVERTRAFLCDGAFIFCSQPHHGVMPHMMRCTWKRNNPAWTSDSSICIQEVGKQSTDSSMCLQEVGSGAAHKALEEEARVHLVQEMHMREMHEAKAEQRLPPKEPMLRGAAWASDETPEEKRRSSLKASVPEDKLSFAPGVSMTEITPFDNFDSDLKVRSSDISSGTALLGSEPAEVQLPTGGIAESRRKSTRMSQAGLGAVSNRVSICEGAVMNAPKGMFADGDAMKANFYKNLIEGEYKVEDQYHTSGYAQWIAKHNWFEYGTLVVIVMNALWIGIDSDYNDADALPLADWPFVLVEHFFCTVFTLELVTRFAAFSLKSDAFKDYQFIFDFALVGLMIFETWVIYIIFMFTDKNPLSGAGAVSLLRMLRLTRICRLVRLLRSVPSLMVLIKGIGAAFQPVSWTMMFLVIIMYVFAVAFKILVGGNTDPESIGKKYFSSIPKGMSTLLLPGMLPDNQEHVEAMAAENFIYAVMFMAFIVLASITIMNMLVGVLVEVVSVVATFEKEQLTANYVKMELKNLVEQHLDADGSGTLSKTEIESLLMNRKAAQVIQQVGVDVAGLVEIAEFHLFNDKDEIRFEDFLELVLQLRGNQDLCVRDLVNLRKFILEELGKMEQHITHTMEGQALRNKAEEALMLAGQAAGKGKSQGGTLAPSNTCAFDRGSQ